MTETLETADEIRRIRDRVDAIEATQQLLLRKDAAQLTEIILQRFEGNEILASIYLAVDGRRTQSQVVQFLKENGLRGSKPTVTRGVRVLRDEGLIERLSLGKEGVVWGKKKSVDRVLGLTKALQKKASANGRVLRDRDK
jgi:hypothetical protein